MSDHTIGGRADSRIERADEKATPAIYDTRHTETRRAFKTSEFWVFLLVAAGVIIATYTDDNDSLTEWRGWLLFCAVGIAYIVSRGLAKAGSSEPRVERIHLD